MKIFKVAKAFLTPPYIERTSGGDQRGVQAANLRDGADLMDLIGLKRAAGQMRRQAYAIQETQDRLADRYQWTLQFEQWHGRPPGIMEARFAEKHDYKGDADPHHMFLHPGIANRRE